LFLGGILLAFQVFAAEEKPWAEQLKGELSDIKVRLATLEEQQKEIIAKEDKILEEVDRVRIWVHKR
jgi:hypothetical protein